MMRSTIMLWSMSALLAGGAAAAAEDLQPAVNTSSQPARETPAPAAPARTPPSQSTDAARPAGATPPDRAPARVPAPAAPARPQVAVPATGAPAAAGSARDRIELQNTQITGNSELPKIMYVVPWKKPGQGDLGGRPAKSLLDEVLEPVDREVFRRQNRYFDALPEDMPATRDGDEK